MIHLSTYLQIFKKKSIISDTYNFVNSINNSSSSILGVRKHEGVLLFDKQWEFPIDRLKFGKLFSKIVCLIRNNLFTSDYCINLGKQIGSGNFGVVFEAKAYDMVDKNTVTTVAVKTIKISANMTCGIEALISELNTMIHVGRHMNVVNLLGACMGDMNKSNTFIFKF